MLAHSSDLSQNRRVDWTIEVQGGLIPVEGGDSGPLGTLILGPGAGSHRNHKTMLWLGQIAESAGLDVVRFDFLYRTMGKSMPDRMPTLMGTYKSVIESVRTRKEPDRLFIGGHSMGGRVASMLAAEEGLADGLILFGYPLHPPGQPEKLRDAHLPAIRIPVLQMNGTEDELCTKALMDGVLERLDPLMWTLEWIDGADHSYGVRKSTGRSREDVAGQMKAAIKGWLARQ